MWGEVARYLNVTAITWAVGLSVLVAIVGAAIGYATGGWDRAAKTAGWLLLLGTIATVLVVTFDGFAYGGISSFQAGNWIPFKTITGQLFHHTNPALGLANVVGNIALFAPTGLLSALLLPRWWQAIALSPAMSVLIEFTQQFTGRSGDIDDVILNSAGGTIGAVIGLVVVRWWRSKDRPPAFQGEAV